MAKFEHLLTNGKLILQTRLTTEEATTKNVIDALAEIQEFLQKKHSDFKPNHKIEKD